MSKIQDEIFFLTRKLTGQINLIRIFFYTLITSIMISIVLLIFGFFTEENWIVIFFIIGMAMVYSAVRDVSITRYQSKQMDKYYDHLRSKENNVQLYIPLLEKSYQGYFLKRSAIYLKDNTLFLIAFQQKRGKDQEQVSISVKYGDSFVIDRQKGDKNMKSVTFDSTFSTQYYRFSVVNQKEAIEAINLAIKGEKK